MVEFTAGQSLRTVQSSLDQWSELWSNRSILGFLLVAIVIGPHRIKAFQRMAWLFLIWLAKSHGWKRVQPNYSYLKEQTMYRTYGSILYPYASNPGGATLNVRKFGNRVSNLSVLLTVGTIALMLSASPAHAVLGQCKDMAINIVNKTGLTITVPSEGHKVKNPGGLEGWNNLTLGGSISDLADGKNTSVRQTLNIKCVDDAEFEIHYSAVGGRDFTQIFSHKNIKNKNVTLTLTHN